MNCEFPGPRSDGVAWDGYAGIARDVALKKSFWDLFGVDGSLNQVSS